MGPTKSLTCHVLVGNVKLVKVLKYHQPKRGLEMIHSLKLTASSPLKIDRAPKGNSSTPTIDFQGLLLAVSLREVSCFNLYLIGFFFGSRVVIPLIFPKVPQSSQTESLGF